MNKTQKRISLKTIMIAAIITVLAVGTAVAARELDIFDFNWQMTPLEGAETLVSTDVAADKGEYLLFSIEEALYDGQGAIIKMRYQSAQPDKYPLYSQFIDYYDDPDYLFEHIEYKDGSGSIELKGRTDGKSFLSFAPRPVLIDADGNETLFDTWDAYEDTDGSIVIMTSCALENAAPDKITLKLDTIANLYTPETNYAYKQRTPVSIPSVTIDLPGTEEGKTAEYAIDPAGNNDKVVVSSLKIHYTPAYAYYTYEMSQKLTDENVMGYTLFFYLPDGTRIPDGSGGGQIISTENGWETAINTGTMQTYDPIPETIILKYKVIGEDRYVGETTATLVKD